MLPLLPETPKFHLPSLSIHQSPDEFFCLLQTYDLIPTSSLLLYYSYDETLYFILICNHILLWFTFIFISVSHYKFTEYVFFQSPTKNLGSYRIHSAIIYFMNEQTQIFVFQKKKCVAYYTENFQTFLCITITSEICLKIYICEQSPDIKIFKKLIILIYHKTCEAIVYKILIMKNILSQQSQIFRLKLRS